MPRKYPPGIYKLIREHVPKDMLVWGETVDYYDGQEEYVSFNEDSITFFRNGIDGHRLMGPYFVNIRGQKGYALYGCDMDEKEYWQEMYKIYKGTSREAECLANLMGSE